MDKKRKGSFNFSLEKQALFEKLRQDQGRPGTVAPLIARSKVVSPIPLSFAQQRLWFLDHWEPASSLYNVPVVFRLRGALQIHALEAALNALVVRHESLRTIFPTKAGSPQQKIQPAEPTSKGRLVVTDIQNTSREIQEAELLKLIEQETHQPFDLARGPLLRARIIQVAATEAVFILTLHHIISDGWSMNVLLKELSTLYNSTGTSQDLVALPIQYADYSIWQHAWLQGEVLAKQVTYWKEKLQGAPATLRLPTDYPRPRVQSYRGARQRVQVSPGLTQKLKTLSQKEGVTLFMTGLATFQVLLARYTGEKDIVVGTPIANRTRQEIEELIGFFVNTLVLRTRLAHTLSFRQLLHQVRTTCLEAYRHQDLPFEKLVEVLKPERDTSRHPLFQVMFQLDQEITQTLHFTGLTSERMQVTSATAKFDLSLALVEQNNTLDGTIEYSTDLFSNETITRLIGHFHTLLEGLVASPEQPVLAVDLLTEPERHQQLVEWNPTTTYPSESCIHHLFEGQVARTPDAIAVVSGDKQLTYAQLNQRSNQLAHYLLGKGVGPEVPIGVCLERSADLLVTLLAILKAGGVYVPLDPSNPKERLAYIIKDARLPCLVTTAALQTRLPLGTYRLIILDSEQPRIDQEPKRNLPTIVCPENLAYVMYTSGSTGKPKGTLISQRSVVRLVKEINYAKLDAQERFLQIAPIAFDASTFEMWGSLLNGATLVVFPSGPLSIENLGAMLETERISIIWLTASLFHQMVEQEGARLSQVTQVLAGGDVLAPKTVQQLVRQMGEGRVINGYGPTENTTFTCCHIMTRESQFKGSVPIGKPISHTQVYVIDPAQQLVPVGISGELLVGGEGLAWGYVNQPALTAEKFVPFPFSAEPGARVYKTGDQVCWQDIGVLEFLGRQDAQIKLRGYRIELGEIEVPLREHPAVQDVVVVCREDRPGEKRLVAYIVGQASASDLWSYLQDRLPDYMLPFAFIALEQFPLTPNGKIDRRALPPPGTDDRLQGQIYVAPRTPIEEALVAIWQEVLGLEQIGIYANFFELGGHSLLATQVVSRVRTQFQLEVPLLTFFQLPTIEELANTLSSSARLESQPRVLPLNPSARPNPLPLSFAQQRFWFLEQVEQGEGVFCIPVLLRLQGNLNIAALERSFQTLIRRHEILRTSFPDEEGTPTQVIAPDWDYTLPLSDVKGQTEHERLDVLYQLVDESVLQPFDLRHGPLMKTTLFRVQESEYFLLITFHHIISDGWSMGIFTQELVAAYDAYSKCREPLLPPLPFQYADYTLWQHDWLQGERLDELLSHWRRQLAGAPTVLSLPTDHSRFLAKTVRGASEKITLPVSLTMSLKELARRERTTLFMVLLATFKVLIARYTRCFDILVGTPIANRSRTDLEKLIGFFANTLVLRTDLSQNPSFLTLLARVRKGCLEAYSHQDLPFEKLVEGLRPERDSTRHPLIQVLFAFQNAPTPSWKLEGLQVASLPLDSQKVAFDVAFSLREHDKKIQGSMTYQIELFDKGSITRMLGHFQSLLESIVTNPDQPISALTLLTEQECHALLSPNDETPTSHWSDRRIHICFQQHAIKNPDKIALVYEDEQVTYRQLNERANQLAHCLQQRGVKPEVCIALHLERSVNLIVALLGILKAGGCYVPLDPTVPSERLDFILKDARIGLVLTDKDRVKGWSEHSMPHLCIDEDAIFDYQSKEDPRNEVSAGNLAYIIFTSGSTGLPKGVGVTHNNVVRLFEQTQDWFHFDEHDTWTIFHSLAFDFSVWELFGALLHGGKMVLVPHWVSRTPDTFYELVMNEQVTILNQTPSAFQQFIRTEEAARTNNDLALRLVIFGGEALDFQSLNPWWERHGDQVPQLINMYGITETTVHVTYRPLTLVDLAPAATSRIGNPIPDLQIYILDHFQQPVPIGVPGEMYIGGVGVTRGYVNQPELTSARFIPNPYSQQAGTRLYRSGDLARYLSSGDIEYLGRVDHQVKIRGFRIELGEIESVLAQYSEVRKAVVIVREDQLEEKRLVAYLVVADEATLSIPTLRTYLGQWLPNYMIPSAFMILASLPLTSNGKIDRERLPAPESSRENSDQPFEHARTPIEEKLVNIWRELLNVGQVGIRDSFFDLGGHSLILTKLANRIQDTFQVRLPLRVIFDLPTIERMSQAIVEEQVKTADPVTITHLLSKLRELSPEQVSELLKGQNEG